MIAKEQQITQAIRELLATDAPAGVSVAVTDREKRCYHAAFGVESVERPSVPNEPDALYRVASITKILVSVLIQRLVEQGAVALDEPVKTYLPNLVLSRAEAEQQVTVLHLLTHTAGFPTEDWLEEGSRDEDTMEDAVLRTVAQLPVLSLPREGVYRYSNAGYNLLALIAEKVTGRRFSALMEEQVLRPLGMKTATFDFHTAATYPISQPHQREENGRLYAVHHQRMNTAYHGAGGLFANASELCAVARFFLNNGVCDSGERLLSEEGIQDILQKRQRRNALEHYGLGMFIREVNGRCLYGHTGNYTPYNSSLFFDYESGYGVATLINTANCEPLRYSIPERIFEILNG